MPLAPVKLQARWAQPVEADAQEVKRRRLETWNATETEGMMDSSEEALEAGKENADGPELEDMGQELALIPSEASARSARREVGCFGLSSHCPASILSCIRDAFSSPSWEPSLRNMHSLSQRPWLNDNEDALENLIIFKDGVGSSEQQMNLWSRPNVPLKLEREADEPTLPGLVIFDDHLREHSTWQRPSPIPSLRIEEVLEEIPSRIEEVQEVPMEMEQ